MKKFLISLTLLIFLTISTLILYLSFYGYQTDRFNKIIKTEIEKNQKIINLDFKKISFLLDIKKINLLVKFIDSKIDYKSTEIPLKSLKANLDLVLLIKNEVGIKNIELEIKNTLKYDLVFATGVLNHIKKYKKIVNQMIKNSNKYVFFDAPRIHLKPAQTAKMNLSRRFEDKRKSNLVKYYIEDASAFFSFLKKIFNKKKYEIHIFSDNLPLHDP